MKISPKKVNLSEMPKPEEEEAKPETATQAPETPETPEGMSDQSPEKRPEMTGAESGAEDSGLRDTAHLEGVISHYTVQEKERVSENVRAGMVEKEAFFATFCFMFQAPNLIAKVPGLSERFPLLPLKSLPIAAHEKEHARGASDALYDIVLETPQLHFLLKTDGVWMGRLMAIGGFALVKLASVQAEIEERTIDGTATEKGDDDDAEA